MGRILIYAGIAMVAVGILVTVLPIRLGRLPGDVVFRGKNTTFYFPVVTCLLISAVLTILSWIFSRR